MSYFVKIHIPTGLIQGYLEPDVLRQLKSAYETKSDIVCDICLIEGSRYGADYIPINVSISPQQIIAIESKFVN